VNELLMSPIGANSARRGPPVKPVAEPALAGGAFLLALCYDRRAMPKAPSVDPHAEIQAYIIKRARELAVSGHYYSWRDIEVVLRFEEGLPEARQWFGNPLIRDELDRLCEDARQSQTREPARL
jgi:hypothetical protein